MRGTQKSLISQAFPGYDVSPLAVSPPYRRTRLLVNSSALIPIPVSRSIRPTQNTGRRTRTSDDDATTNAIFVLHSLDSHVQRGNTIIEVFLRKSSQAELLKCVIGIRNQFSEENIPKVTESGPIGKEVNKRR